MRNCWLIGLGAAAGLAAPASADVVASYHHLEDGSTIKVEAADSGDARLQYSNQPFYLIIRGGETFVVYTFTPQPRVVRVADLQKVFEQSPPAIHLQTTLLNQVSLVAAGTATYAGYSGKAYVLQTKAGRSSRPALVVSQNAKLSGIGVPIARQMDFSIATMKLAGQAIPPTFLKLREYIGTGTPLLFAGYVMDKVTTATVDAHEFDLPAAPVPIEELRANAAARRSQ